MRLVAFLVGPTATDKTKIATSLAKRINAEIVSCDSMQVYKNIDILSAKIPPKFRKRISHHLIDLVKPNQEYNVATYRRDVLSAIKKIHQKKKIPLIVGGSGLYMSVILDGIFPQAGKSETYRKNLTKQAKRYGSAYLYKRLKRIDSQAARKIHPNDLRRIIRALEVYKLTGEPISQLQKRRKGLENKFKIKIFGLVCPRKLLYRRIDQRVDKMFNNGAVNEVKNLLNKGLSKTVSQMIGIKQIKGYLRGKYPLEEAKRLLKRDTRHYAKRQLSWFRRDKRIKWIKVNKYPCTVKVVKKIISNLRDA